MGSNHSYTAQNKAQSQTLSALLEMLHQMWQIMSQCNVPESGVVRSTQPES